MATVSYTMEVPKESKEVVDLLAAVIKKLKAGAPITDYATLIGDLTAAVAGVDQLGSELASEGRDEVAGYLVHKVMGELLPVSPVTP